MLLQRLLAGDRTETNLQLFNLIIAVQLGRLQAKDLLPLAEADRPQGRPMLAEDRV